ncbi:MAG: hypothetical protein PHE25_05715 [Candidatus Gracilibacteria bacterium]|nr:hypothetical protein [Candidatus Gracilibacteria bacterium]
MLKNNDSSGIGGTGINNLPKQLRGTGKKDYKNNTISLITDIIHNSVGNLLK